jgi:hypothetical protein
MPSRVTQLAHAESVVRAAREPSGAGRPGHDTDDRKTHPPPGRPGKNDVAQERAGPLVPERYREHNGCDDERDTAQQIGADTDETGGCSPDVQPDQ